MTFLILNHHFFPPSKIVLCPFQHAQNESIICSSPMLFSIIVWALYYVLAYACSAAQELLWRDHGKTYSNPKPIVVGHPRVVVRFDSLTNTNFMGPQRAFNLTTPACDVSTNSTAHSLPRKYSQCACVVFCWYPQRVPWQEVTPDVGIWSIPSLSIKIHPRRSTTSARYSLRNDNKPPPPKPTFSHHQPQPFVQRTNVNPCGGRVEMEILSQKQSWSRFRVREEKRRRRRI